MTTRSITLATALTVLTCTGAGVALAATSDTHTSATSPITANETTHGVERLPALVDAQVTVPVHPRHHVLLPGRHHTPPAPKPHVVVHVDRAAATFPAPAGPTATHLQSAVAPPSADLPATAPFDVVQTTERITRRGEIVVTGTALNPTEWTFDRAEVHVDLYDATGNLLNPRVPGELEQTAGSTIRPGADFPFRWSQATPSAYDHAVVTARGVDAVAAPAPADVTVTVRSRSDLGSGTVVTGVVGSGSPLSLGLEIAAYDANGELLALGSATFAGCLTLVTDAGGSWQWRVRLDAPLEDIATIRTIVL